jgi:hypothetical protein
MSEGRLLSGVKLLIVEDEAPTAMESSEGPRLML